MIDFKKFKKIEANDKFTVLQHDNGHEIKISHKGLSDSHLKELDKMPIHAASGGKMKGRRGAYRFKESYYTQRPGHGVGPEMAHVSQPSQAAAPKEGFTEPRDIGTPLKKLIVPKTPRGERHEYAQNIDVSRAADKGGYPPCINPSCKSYGRPHPNCLCYGGTERLAEGGSVDGYCSKGDRPHEKGCEYFKLGGLAEGEAPGVDPTAQENQPEVMPAPTPMPLPGPGTKTGTPEQPDWQGSYGVAAPASYENMPQLDTTVVQASPVQMFQSQKDNARTDMLNEAQAHKNDLDMGHIKPETYHDLFAKKDTLGKIGTIFGMILGGMGAGLSRQPNMLFTMMDNEIARDLEAQKAQQANKVNFLNINSHILKSGPYAGLSADAAAKAYGLARMQMNNTALHHLTQLAGKFPEGSPQWKMYQTMLATMNNAVQNENFNIADRAATAQAAYNLWAGNDSGMNTLAMKSGMFGPEVARAGEDIEQKTIPGVPGRASRPIQQQDRDKIQAMNVLSDKAQDLMQYAGKNWGTLSPAKRAVAQQKADELINFYNQSISNQVLTHGHLQWLEDQINKNPTGLMTQLMGNQQRLQEIKNSNDHRRDLLLNSYGLKGQSKKQSFDEGTTSKTGKKMVKHGDKWVYQ